MALYTGGKYNFLTCFNSPLSSTSLTLLIVADLFQWFIVILFLQFRWTWKEQRKKEPELKSEEEDKIRIIVIHLDSFNLNYDLAFTTPHISYISFLLHIHLDWTRLEAAVNAAATDLADKQWNNLFAALSIPIRGSFVPPIIYIRNRLCFICIFGTNNSSNVPKIGGKVEAKRKNPSPLKRRKTFTTFSRFYGILNGSCSS